MEDKVLITGNTANTIDVFIASLPRQLHVLTTVNSFINQPEVKTITIVANKYSDEEFQALQNGLLSLNANRQIPIYLHRGDNKKGSNEKLKYISKGEGKYISFVDDDLILPPDYFKYMIWGCEHYDAYVSLHGVCVYPRPIRSYYRDRYVYRGLGMVIRDAQVDIASNCGSLFKRSFFTNKELQEFYTHAPQTSMDDILMATACMRKGISCWVLKHNEGYLKHKVQYDEDDYVFNRYALTGHDEVQTEYVNKYLRTPNI